MHYSVSEYMAYTYEEKTQLNKCVLRLECTSESWITAVRRLFHTSGPQQLL